MASWLEISIDAHGDPDALCELLSTLGYGGFVVEDETDFHKFLDENSQYWDFVDEKLETEFAGTSRVKFWLTDDDEGTAHIAELYKKGFTPKVTPVKDSDWENNWRDYYKPLEVGKKLVIVPEWDQFESVRTPVVLDPGLLFGTGQHATTYMCLEALEKVSAPGKKVLDPGCGSGILGITAAVLGCESVTAADIDPKAPEIVKANAALNGCEDKFTIYVGDVVADAQLRKKLGGGYDIVVANIVADVIITLAPHVRGFMAPGSVFIASGIINGREGDVEDALKAAGLNVIDHRTQEEWHCYACSL